MASPALTQDQKTIANDLSKKISGAAIEVHRILGPGLLESAYEECTYHELSMQEVALERQVPLPIRRVNIWTAAIDSTLSLENLLSLSLRLLKGLSQSMKHNY